MTRLFLLISLTWVVHFKAAACSCQDPYPIPEAFKNTSLVIHGKVISKEFVTYAETIKSDKIKMLRAKLEGAEKKMIDLDAQFIVKVKIKVLNSFKNNSGNKFVTVYTTRTGASCGFTHFEEGQEYIIYGSPYSYIFSLLLGQDLNDDLEKENTYWTNHCTRTKFASYQRELDELKILAENNLSQRAYEIIIRSLISRKVVKVPTDTIYVKIAFDNNLEEQKFVFETHGKIIVTGVEKNNRKNTIFLTNISVRENDERDINFKIFAGGGQEISGTVTLAKANGETIFKSISYISSID